MKPEDVLKQMVATANEEYGKYDLAAKAKELELENPLQVVTVASLVQAEGKTHDDFRKMAEVVYNRLKPTNTETNQLLQFDSTYNYLKGQSKIDISSSPRSTATRTRTTPTRTGPAARAHRQPRRGRAEGRAEPDARRLDLLRRRSTARQDRIRQDATPSSSKLKDEVQ